jgi:hypothetical protein
VFNLYIVLLALSGVAMLAMGLVRRGRSTLSRSINLIMGAIFVGYAIYLEFIFDGGSYLIFFQAFIVPVVMAIDFFRGRTPRPKLTETQKAWRDYQKSEQA